MTITFNQIPANQRVPGVYVEVDNTLAVTGLIQQNYRMLVLGQKLAAGTAVADQPVLVTSKAKAIEFFGQGSQLAIMFDIIFDNNASVEKWALPFDDAGTAVKATGAFTFSGTSTAAGVVSAYVDSVLIQVPIPINTTAAAAALLLTDAINNDDSLSVDASNVTVACNVTAKNGGTVGNDIDLRLNYGGDLAGQEDVPGLPITITAMASGAIDPDLTLGIANLSDEIYNTWVGPYTDATNITVIKNELNRRFGALVQLEGHYHCSRKDTVSNLITYAATINNEHITMFDASNNSPSAPYRWAAAEGAQAAGRVSVDPARPFTGLPLIGILAPPIADRRTTDERNSLLFGGVATHIVNNDGTVSIERDITTYTTNSGGSPDPSYLNTNTLYNLSFLRQSIINRIKTKYPDYKLADNGVRLSENQAVVTPNVIKGEMIDLGQIWFDSGLIDNLDDFVNTLEVERDISDRDRLNVAIQPTLTGGFRIMATALRFKL